MKPRIKMRHQQVSLFVNMYLFDSQFSDRSKAGSRLRDHFIKVLEQRQQADEALCEAAMQLDVSITWHLGPFPNGFQQAAVQLQRPLPTS